PGCQHRNAECNAEPYACADSVKRCAHNDGNQHKRNGKRAEFDKTSKQLQNNYYGGEQCNANQFLCVFVHIQFPFCYCSKFTPANTNSRVPGAPLPLRMQCAYIIVWCRFVCNLFFIFFEKVNINLRTAPLCIISPKQFLFFIQKLKNIVLIVKINRKN